jgi:hypothetical protein
MPLSSLRLILGLHAACSVLQRSAHTAPSDWRPLRIKRGLGDDLFLDSFDDPGFAIHDSFPQCGRLYVVGVESHSIAASGRMRSQWHMLL